MYWYVQVNYCCTYSCTISVYHHSIIYSTSARPCIKYLYLKRVSGIGTGCIYTNAPKTGYQISNKPKYIKILAKKWTSQSNWRILGIQLRELSSKAELE